MSAYGGLLQVGTTTLCVLMCAFARTHVRVFCVCTWLPAWLDAWLDAHVEAVEAWLNVRETFYLLFALPAALGVVRNTASHCQSLSPSTALLHAVC